MKCQQWNRRIKATSATHPARTGDRDPVLLEVVLALDVLVLRQALHERILRYDQHFVEQARTARTLQCTLQ